MKVPQARMARLPLFLSAVAWLSSSFAGQKPPQRYAMCEKSPPCSAPHSRLVLVKGRYIIHVHAEMNAGALKPTKRSACKPSHLCCKTLRQRRRGDLASGVELTAGVGDGGEASVASSCATALSTPSGRASGSVSRGASTRPACQEAASGIESGMPPAACSCKSVLSMPDYNV